VVVGCRAGAVGLVELVVQKEVPVVVGCHPALVRV
jgi:hypothetical protein